MKRGVVIVGSGLIARFHAQAVRASGKLELKGFCDTYSLESARRAAAEFGGEAWGDFDSAFSSSGVGMVTVATASGGHDDAVFAAARHKVPVLVEKPLSITVARIDALIAACKEAGVPLGCILQTRFSALYEEAKAKVESGELGRITYAGIRIPWWRDDEYYTKSSWHGTWKVDGGGALINQSIHMVDWLVSLMPEVEDVKAFAATLAHPMETEDTVSAALRFKGGALGGVYAATSSFPCPCDVLRLFAQRRELVRAKVYARVTTFRRRDTYRHAGQYSGDDLHAYSISPNSTISHPPVGGSL